MINSSFSNNFLNENNSKESSGVVLSVLKNAKDFNSFKSSVFQLNSNGQIVNEDTRIITKFVNNFALSLSWYVEQNYSDFQQKQLLSKALSSIINGSVISTHAIASIDMVLNVISNNATINQMFDCSKMEVISKEKLSPDSTRITIKDINVGGRISITNADLKIDDKQSKKSTKNNSFEFNR